MTPEPSPLPDPPSQPDAAGVPTPAPPPPVSDRALWLEVFAVLSIGVFPYMASAVTSAVQPLPLLPYWLNALSACVYSGCTIFAVLYLIHRSGEPWSTFGVTRPGAGDVFLGLTLFMADYVVWVVVRPLLPEDPAGWRVLFPWPERAADYLL